MNDDINTLLAIAEIAGVFIGFAAVGAVVGQTRSNKTKHGDGRLINVALISTMVIAASLVPIVFSRYGISDDHVWRISAGIFFGSNLALLILLIRVTAGFSQIHAQMPWLSGLVWCLEPFIQIPLLLCIFGVWPDLAPSFYLTAVVTGVLQVSLFFAHFVTAMITAADG